VLEGRDEELGVAGWGAAGAPPPLTASQRQQQEQQRQRKLQLGIKEHAVHARHTRCAFCALKEATQGSVLL